MIITFAHYKGGTGKTTSCLSVAGWLARFGKKVLVIDLDPQGNATSGLGINRGLLERSTYDVMSKKRKVSSVILKTKYGIDIVPSSNKLSEISLIAHRNKKDARILKEALEEIKTEYDFILIDTPPIHGQLIINGLIASDKTILVLDAGVFSYEGLQTLKEIFSNILKKFEEEFNIFGVLITRANRGLFGYKKSVKEIQEKVEKLLGIKANLIPYSEDIYESHKRKKLINFYKPNSKVSKAYKKVAESLLRS